MKLKLLAFAFILAFAISTFGALGASGASADGVALVIVEAGITVPGPDAAIGGAVTAFTNVSANTEIANIDVDFSC